MQESVNYDTILNDTHLGKKELYGKTGCQNCQKYEESFITQ
jgi:hypothetical protein